MKYQVFISKFMDSRYVVDWSDIDSNVPSMNFLINTYENLSTHTSRFTAACKVIPLDNLSYIFHLSFNPV